MVLHWLRAHRGNDERALAALDQVKSDKAGAENFPRTRHLRGLIYSERGDFAETAVELRIFLDAAPDAPTAKAVEKRLNEWQQLGVV